MNQPIGFFDSGIGGISLLPAVEALLPRESICYIADHAYSPYGEKATEVVLARAQLITEQLMAWKCKLIVLACNTATTQIIDELRRKYPLPFVGIEPAIKPAVAVTKSRKVGVLATQGTLESELYQQTVSAYGNKISIIEQIGSGLVECVEAGKIDDKATLALLKTYLNPMLLEGIDTLVLGCTHYPFLLKAIQQILPPSITIIDNSQAIARQIKRLLQNKSTLANDTMEKNVLFYSTVKENNLKRFTAEKVAYLAL